VIISIKPVSRAIELRLHGIQGSGRGLKAGFRVILVKRVQLLPIRNVLTIFWLEKGLTGLAGECSGGVEVQGGLEGVIIR